MTNVIRVAEPPSAKPMNARDVVAAYVKGRSDVGVSTSRLFRGVMGKQAKLLLSQGWSAPVIIAAAQQFGASRKHPAFLEEWVKTTYWKWQDAEHAVRRAEENAPMAPEVAALLAGITKRVEE